MTSRKVYRDKDGKFTTREKASKQQTVIGGIWSPIVEEIKEVHEEFEEFEYFVGFNYETPTIKSGQETLMEHGKHDFKTEFRVTSPDRLNSHEVKQLIQSTFNDYGVLKNNEAYNIKSPTRIITNERPSLNVKRTAKIER